MGVLASAKLSLTVFGVMVGFGFGFGFGFERGKVGVLVWIWKIWNLKEEGGARKEARLVRGKKLLKIQMRVLRMMQEK
jgi:hypothetical protein